MKKTVLPIIGIITMLGIMIFVMNHMQDGDAQADQTSISDKHKAEMKFIHAKNAGSYANGFYTINDEGDHIMYYDYQTQKEIYLCNKPNCKHEDHTCTSYLDNGELNEIFCYDNHLYLVNAQAAGNIVVMNFDGAEIEDSEGTPTTVYRMNLDGTDKQKLFTVPSGTQMSMPYMIQGHTMYAFLETYEKKKINEHSVKEAVSAAKLIAIDLDQGSYTEIADGMNQSFLGVYQNKLLIQEIVYAQDPQQFDDDTLGYIDNLYQSKIKIRLFDCDSKKTEIIYEDSYKNAEQMYCDDNGIYILGQHSKKLEYFDIAAKQKTTFLSLPEADMELSSIIDHKLLAYSYKDEDAHIKSAYVIDLKTKEIKDFHLVDKNHHLVDILAVNDEYYFVQTERIYGEEYTTWAGTKQQDIIDVHYGIIKKADYWSSKPNYRKMENVK